METAHCDHPLAGNVAVLEMSSKTWPLNGYVIGPHYTVLHVIYMYMYIHVGAHIDHPHKPQPHEPQALWFTMCKLGGVPDK